MTIRHTLTADLVNADFPPANAWTARLNAGRLGIGLLAIIQVTVSPHSKENAIKEFVNGVEEIQEAYALTGDADYLLKVAVPDLSGLPASKRFGPAAGQRVARQIVDRVDDAQGQPRLPLRAAKSGS